MENNVALRIPAIDRFRGFAVLFMVFANYSRGVSLIPVWLKHAAPGRGMTVIDLIAPFFIFAISLTYGRSLNRRISRSGTESAVFHFLTRYLAFAGIGFLITALELWFLDCNRGINWGVLQAIGVSGLITLPFLFIPTVFRILAGFILLAGYQWFLLPHWITEITRSPHAGIQGVLGWAAMLILATVIADLFYAPNGRKLLPLSSLFTLVLGLLLSLIVSVSKVQVSASYVLISLGASGFLFHLFQFLPDKESRFPLLEIWGQNPLLLYVGHYLLLAVIVLPGVPEWYTQAPGWLVGTELLMIMGTLSAVGWHMKKMNIFFSL